LSLYLSFAADDQESNRDINFKGEGVKVSIDTSGSRTAAIPISRLAELQDEIIDRRRILRARRRALVVRVA
jgi:hypothetical protein